MPSSNCSVAAAIDSALADLAPRDHLVPAVRPLVFELLDRGELFLAHARGVHGLGGLDHGVEDFGAIFGLARSRRVEPVEEDLASAQVRIP